MVFFNKIKQIKSKESRYQVIENFIEQDEIVILKNIHDCSKDRFVNRDDGTKTSLGPDGGIPAKQFNDWHQTIRQILLPKVEDLIGEFDICETDYPPHFFHTRFPTTVHADTGRDPNVIIGKQILVPLNIDGSGTPHTIIFKNRWYGPASRFVNDFISKQEQMNHATICDDHGKFITFTDLAVFHEKVKNNFGKTVKENGGVFTVTNNLLSKLNSCLNKERYNEITNSHITDRKEFDREDYNTYLTHIKYEDLVDLEIEFSFEWKIGSALLWDRTQLHGSDNYLQNNVNSKLGISFFTIIPQS